MTIAVRSLGNWSTYLRAIGDDPSRRFSKTCGSSLNSRKSQRAWGVYVRPAIEEGFLWYSWGGRTTEGSVRGSKGV